MLISLRICQILGWQFGGKRNWLGGSCDDMISAIPHSRNSLNIARLLGTAASYWAAVTVRARLALSPTKQQKSKHTSSGKVNG